MNTPLLLTAMGFMLGFCVAIPAQLPGLPPPGTADKSVESDEIKERSIELERVRRDAVRGDLRPDVYRQFNFAEIKKDFEQIQLVFDSCIVKTYRSTDPIDYDRISNASAEIRDRAIRLKANLFFERTKKDKVNGIESSSAQLQEVVKRLIVNLNEALGSLVANPIFQNVKVIDPKDSNKAKADLNRIILLSSQLSRVGGKQE